jgi:hypothetical protein
MKCSKQGICGRGWILFLDEAECLPFVEAGDFFAAGLLAEQPEDNFRAIFEAEHEAFLTRLSSILLLVLDFIPMNDSGYFHFVESDARENTTRDNEEIDIGRRHEAQRVYRKQLISCPQIL